MSDRLLTRKRVADTPVTPSRTSDRAATSTSRQSLRSSTLNQVVLAEEEYVAALSYLIRRDFFPDNEGVDVAVAESGEELNDANFPLKVIEHLGLAAAEELTIGSFQANFTSEDNASFQDILQSEKSRRRKAYGWAYDAETNGKGTARNALYYAPPAAIEGSTTEADRLLTDVYEKKNLPNINHRRTRVLPGEQDEAEGSQAGSTSPRSSRIEAAINGSGSVSEYSGLGEETESESGEGYGFVKPVASPRFQHMNRKQQSQLMTWGKIVSTPTAVDVATKDDEHTYNGRFRIPPTPKRDILARSLASKKASTTVRNSSSTRGSTTPARRTPADLTPAARTLLDRTRRRKS